MATNSTGKQAQPSMPHRLALDECAHAEVTGVREVVRFDESAVVLRTVKGILLLQGSELKLKTLAPDGGRVVVDGNVNSVAYSQDHARGGFFRRLLG